MRLDAYLFTSGLARSRTHAQKLIEGGYVLVNGKTVTKVSFPVDNQFEGCVEVTGEPYPYVGRGGVKLEAALDAFAIDVTGLRAVDVGASTGGFTDCLLRNGASKVYAVDSGSGQLDPSLLKDARVVNLEKFNARTLSPVTLGVLCEIAVADLSFISQTYVVSNIASVLTPGGIYVALIKPQFECGRAALDHRGIVRDKKMHVGAIRRVAQCCAENGLQPLSLIVSPITGGDGNREYLLYCRRSETAYLSDDFEKQLCELVK